MRMFLAVKKSSMFFIRDIKMISLKIDFDILQREVEEMVGRKVKRHYIQCIFNPSSKPCARDIKESILKVLTKHIDNDFDLSHEVINLFKGIR